MLVYRICQKNEIETILKDKTFINAGKYYEINNKKNTHKYLINKKYIHFFKDKDSIFYLNTDAKMYICTYNIPNHLLETHYGIGYYLDRIYYKNLEKVDEYAIENEFISFNYLLKIEKIIKYIDIEDYINNDISSKIEIIYLNNQIVNNISIKDNKNKILKL